MAEKQPRGKVPNTSMRVYVKAGRLRGKQDVSASGAPEAFAMTRQPVIASPHVSPREILSSATA